MGSQIYLAKFWSIFLYPQLSCKIKCPLKSRGSPHFMGNTEMKLYNGKNTGLIYESLNFHSSYYFLLRNTIPLSPSFFTCVIGDLALLIPKINFSPTIQPTIQSYNLALAVQRLQRAFMSHCETYLYSFHIAQCCETQQVFNKWWISMCVSQRNA